MSTVLIDTEDLSEAEALLGAAYSRIRLCPRSGDAAMHTRLRRTCVGPLSVDHVEFRFGLTYETDPVDQIHLCRTFSGVVEERTPGRDNVFGRGSAGALGVCEGESVAGAVNDARYCLIGIDRNLLSEVAAGPPTHSFVPVALTSGVPRSSAANQLLVDAIDYLRRGVVAHPDAAREPLVAGAVARYLAACVLTAFPHTALLDPTVEDRHDTTPVLLRRAIAFIDDNAHIDITLKDIADAVHVTPRALRHMFRKHRDCTPMEYVRRVRLHYAHLDLVSGSPLTTTVGKIARRWGFGHLGRFAVCWRQHYGESPHETLRR